MATYARIEQESDLPPVGQLSKLARERGDLDFKVYAEPGDSIERGKDIAAFANALGGVLLIGATDNAGAMVYPGLQRGQTIADVKALYEQAAEQHCSPPLAVDVVPITLRTGKVVVAVNVDPSVDALVGCNSESKSDGGGWRFPRRVSSQTTYIEPEKLPMYMNAQIRRAYLLLESIPPERRNHVHVHFHVTSTAPSYYGQLAVYETPLTLASVDLPKNALTLSAIIRDSGHSCRVPLLDVLDVWEGANLEWQIKVAGHVMRDENGGGSLSYKPLPAR